jgi:2-C-methyl-D-erythritol 4-phosphate cytidylyltransferase
MSVDAIILAAGHGTRSKLNYPKQHFRLNGRPLFVIAVDLLMSIEQIENIILTVIPEMHSEFNELIQKYYPNNSKIKIVFGGKTRQESVWLALQHVKSQRVIIHESVRPFVSKVHVEELINAKGDVIVPYIDVIPTIYNKDGYYEDRTKLCNVQLPQVFTTEILKQAHYNARGKNYNDDSSLVCAEFNIQPVLVKGLEENFKITLPTDCLLAEVMSECRQ